MTDNKNLHTKWWHRLYMFLFYVFVFVIILLTVMLQPTADVPAPIMYGVLLILLVDTLYYEVVIRWVTGKSGHGMIRSGRRMLSGKSYRAYLGLFGSICAGLLAGAISLEVFQGDAADFLIWFIIGSFIGTHWHINRLHDKIKEIEKK